MAGILPGVECARRRRFHQTDSYSSATGSNCSNDRTRRYSFCLYTSSSNDTHPNYSSSTSSSLKRSISNHQKTLEQDEKLEGGVREAKERLHEKLRSRSYSSSSSSISVPNKRSSIDKDEDLRLVIEGHLEKKAAGSKKKTCSSTTKSSSLSKRTFMSWAKFGWKSSHQEVCAVCNF